MRENGIYRQIYDGELTWRDQLSSGIGLPVALTTVIGGILAAYLESFTGWEGFLGWWFGTAVVAAVVFFSAAVVALIRARHGYEYERIPYPQEIRAYELELRAYHRNQGTEALFEGQFEDWMDEKFVAAADRNVRNNLRRSHHLYWAMSWIICSFGAIGLAAPPFFLSDQSVACEPPQLETFPHHSPAEEVSNERVEQLPIGEPSPGDSTTGERADTTR